MDFLEIGVGVGSVLPEALKAASATETLLNHAERRSNLSEIYRTIKREMKLVAATAVCADSYEEAAAIAHLNPNIIIAEPPELIGTVKSVGKWQEDNPCQWQWQMGMLFETVSSYFLYYFLALLST